MGVCRDGKGEETALEFFVENRGFCLLMPPSLHPELAGVGIEYSWEKSVRVPIQARCRSSGEACSGQIIIKFHLVDPLRQLACSSCLN